MIIFYVALLIWLLSGSLIVLCAMEFLGVKPTIHKMIAAIIVGPIALNILAWKKEIEEARERINNEKV